MNLTTFSNDVIGVIWPLLLFWPVLLVVHFLTLGVFRLLSGRLRPSSVGHRLRQLLGIQCWLPFTYIPLAMILPDYGRTGEPLGISYTGAFSFCVVGSLVLLGHLLAAVLTIRGLIHRAPPKETISVATS